MEQNELLLKNTDFEDFRDWIQLNLEGVTWQGRFTKQFEEFWSLFFIDGLSLGQMMERFRYAYTGSKIGPLSSWFNWLREKFLSYIFINKEVTLYELAFQAKITPSELAGILRGFFVDAYPHRDDYLSEVFQVGNVASESLYLTFKEIADEIQIEEAVPGSNEDDVMPSMEVTLYEEWELFLKRMKKDIYHPQINFKKIKSNASFKRNLKFLLEFVVLLIIGASLILGVNKVNEYWKNELKNKISIYEPQFKWSEKSLTYKSSNKKEVDNIQLQIKDIDDVDETKNQLVIPVEEERFETESEVTLSSWDSLPKDFASVGLEQSSYEESVKKGYRDTRFGGTKVYRVLMKSVQPISTRSKIESFISNYGVTQVDNVKPGQAVPGGIYYNVYVPRENLKEFLAQVMDVDDSILYESRTRTRRNPPGKNKVFIWIKAI